MMFRLNPSPGININARDASEYSIKHRYLRAPEMAKRMHHVNLFLQIFRPDEKLNDPQHWMDCLLKVPDRIKRGEKEIWHGIFIIRPDEKFPGAFRVYADIGSIMDGGLWNEN